MNVLIDTNVISEIRKGARCDAHVASWFASVNDDQLYLSVLTLGEIRRGAEKLRRRDMNGAEALDRWLVDVERAFVGRILPVDSDVAREWGRMSALRTVPVVDCLLAATAKANDLTLVTRNVRDIEGLGAKILDPFAPVKPRKGR
ncbi:type II toxin-antitoxin system VapC family toxin [Methylocystis sp.]|uniref:type II toxin-antitoxin system VapC family toxin n=1 Tax=Methylocystis sp. TaxID=1911079 RepID=UPI003D115A77